MHFKINTLYFMLPSALFVYGLLQSAFSLLGFRQAPRVAALGLCAGLGLIMIGLTVEHRLGEDETEPANYAQIPFLLKADPGMRADVRTAMADHRLTNHEVASLMDTYRKRQREAQFRGQRAQKLASLEKMKAHLPTMRALAKTD